MPRRYEALEGLLRVHAGLRPRQRPHRRLLPLQRGIDCRYRLRPCRLSNGWDSLTLGGRRTARLVAPGSSVQSPKVPTPGCACRPAPYEREDHPSPGPKIEEGQNRQAAAPVGNAYDDRERRVDDDGPESPDHRLSLPPRCSAKSLAAVAAGESRRGALDLGDVERHLEQSDLFVVDRRIDLLLDFVFEDMHHREPQLDSCQRTHIGRISEGHRLGRDLEGFEVGRAEHDDQIVRPVLVHKALDPVLVLRVHGPGGRSDEALRLDEDRLGSCRADAFGDRGARDAVSLPERDHLLAVELHAASPPLRVANASSTCCLVTWPESLSSSSPSRMSM